MTTITLFLIGTLLLIWLIFVLFVAMCAWGALYQIGIDAIELHRRWQQAGIDADKQRLELLVWHSRARCELQAQRRKLLGD